MSGKFGVASVKSQGILFCPVYMNPVIVYQPLWRPFVRPSTFSNICSSEITGQIKLKFHMETP